MWEILTKIPLKSLEWPIYPQKLPKYPQNHKMSKKNPLNHIIDQNSPKIYKMTKITPKPLKWPKQPWNSLNKWSKDENPFEERGNNENQQALKVPLLVLVGPITRARSKKMKETLNGLIQEIWADSNTGHSKLGPKENEGVINLIQAIEGWFGIIGSDLWCGLMVNWFSNFIPINRYFPILELLISDQIHLNFRLLLFRTFLAIFLLWSC